MTAYLILAIGLVVLVLAGDILVRGSVAVAMRLGIPTLIIGLTIVAFGTSAPELMVSLKAAVTGSPGIAVGNVVGSNIANILLVLGLPAMVYAMGCDQPDLMRSTLVMLGATVAFIALACTSPLHVWQGLILVAMLAGFLCSSAARARRSMNAAADSRNARSSAAAADPDAVLAAELDIPDAPSGNLPASVALVVGGLVGLPIGAHMCVSGAQRIALEWGLSESAVGLTIVAIGTSLPELAATTMAALRRESAIAVGNVVGSNIFNLLAIMGITALVAPVPVTPDILHFDLWVMLASSLLMLPLVYWKARIGRLAGLAFVVAYAAYLTAVLAYGTGPGLAT